ncbi:hypothetical protein LCGC14_0866430 [marine sediment metagenome]|uniref:Uncharacterized protein n=1 Tax=marine sediment metagenome TaxID=412755 RepID=A0A0F9P5Z5_9ZZZZ|nr:hypothetical protein [Candidatus Aminicenantes bacterium]HEB36150.1 hypothetical protein [Candidatus Aminicenantes bacterium]
MGDKKYIEEEETRRLGWNPLELEDILCTKVKPHKDHILEKNNRLDKCTIDLRLKDRKTGEIIARIDLESRTNELSKPYFKTIHVPKFDWKGFRNQHFLRRSNKILYYVKHPNNSFHLSWSVNEKLGYLMIAKDILSSPVVKVIDRTGRYGRKIQDIFCYDVPKAKAREINVKDGGKGLIELIISWVKAMGINF